MKRGSGSSEAECEKWGKAPARGSGSERNKSHGIYFRIFYVFLALNLV